MFTGTLLRMEHHKLQKRADNLKEKLAIKGLINELIIEMQQLQRDVNALAERTDEELIRLGLDK